MGRVAGHHVHMVQQNNGTFCSGGSYGAGAPTSRPSGRIFERTVFNSFLVKNSFIESPLPPHCPADSSYRSANTPASISRTDPNTASLSPAGIFEEDVAETPANVTELKESAHSRTTLAVQMFQWNPSRLSTGKLPPYCIFLRFQPRPILVKTNGFLTVSNRVTISGFHAVFISGLPKLPCPFHSLPVIPCPCRSTIAIVIKCLALERTGSIWHPTCNRTSRRRCVGRLEFKAWRSVSAGRLSNSAAFLNSLDAH